MMVKPASDKVLSDIKKTVLDVVFKYLPRETTLIFLFGSQVKKNTFGASDLDIGILSENKIDNSILVKIKNEIIDQARTLRNIDIIDFAAAHDKLFLESSLKEIQIWHKTSTSKTYLD